MPRPSAAGDSYAAKQLFSTFQKEPNIRNPHSAAERVAAAFSDWEQALENQYGKLNPAERAARELRFTKTWKQQEAKAARNGNRTRHAQPRIENGTLGKWHTAKRVRVRRDKSGTLVVDIER